MAMDLVQEMQGLYGPFTLTERVVQKIWLRQDFLTAGLQTESGKCLEVKDPGRWNLLGGPDFKEARLVLNGEPLLGDVEVHFNVADWYAHRHRSNPEFDRVVLHVVLHPDSGRTPAAVTGKGHQPEVVYLLPLLNRDLEAYATDEALLALEKIDDLEWVARFLEKQQVEREWIVAEHARQRWQQKVDFAGKRLAEAGWSEACHQYCLEVFGYSRNRPAMSRIALNYPLAMFAKGGLSVEELVDSEDWRLGGIRPANQPKRRLAQYLEIVAAHPDWPELLAAGLKSWPRTGQSISTVAFRKAVELPRLARELRAGLFVGVLGEKRFNTLMVDAMLPLAMAAGLIEGQPYWMHWPAGDSPDALRRFLKHAQVTSRKRPCSNGWIQGALALSLQQVDS